MNNKIGIISLGCPKALVDSEIIIDRLLKSGYSIVQHATQANLIIINTCGFVNDAIQESFDAIEFALKHNSKIIVTGCLGKRKSFIKKHFPNLIGITGPQAYEEVFKLVQFHLPLSKMLSKQSPLPPTASKLTPSHYAYLKIAEGCNHRCTYCVIPQLRGKLKSRPLRDIVYEAEKLVDHGVKELLLIAQDLMSYGKDFTTKGTFWKGKPVQNTLVDLIRTIKPLNVWIRLHYLYPYPMLDQLVELMAEGKVLPYLDIPLQHINSRILKLMKRPALQTNILKRIARWRNVCPTLTLRSSFIVGFPGESDEEFQELLIFLDEAQLDRVGCFKYSAVEGAKANQFPDPIPEYLKKEREAVLMAVQADISHRKLQSKIGRTEKVIIDEVKKTKLIGRTQGDAPEIDGQVIIKLPRSHNHVIQPGDIVSAKITNADEHDLFALI